MAPMGRMAQPCRAIRAIVAGAVRGPRRLGGSRARATPGPGLGLLASSWGIGKPSKPAPCRLGKSRAAGCPTGAAVPGRTTAAHIDCSDEEQLRCPEGHGRGSAR